MAVTVPYLKILLAIAIIFYAVVVYSFLVRDVMSGHTWKAAIDALLASPFVMIVGRITEQFSVMVPTIKDMFNPNLQSWMFLFGDTIALPFAFGMAALAWRKRSSYEQAMHERPPLIVASALIGLGAGFAFHLHDVTPYTANGAAQALNSLTKLIHDFVAIPLLFGGMVCVGIPIFVSICSRAAPYIHFRRNVAVGLMLIGLLGWFALGALDGAVHHPLPQNMHPVHLFWSLI